MKTLSDFQQYINAVVLLGQYNCENTDLFDLHHRTVVDAQNIIDTADELKMVSKGKIVVKRSGTTKK